MYPTKTDNIVAFARGPAGPAGPIEQSDLDALKGDVPADGDTLKKLYDLIADKAPIDGATLTNATTTTQASGNDSAALATTAFVHAEVANAAADVGAATDDKLADYAKSADVTTALDGKFDKSAVDPDSTFAANSDTRVPSQKAVKTALDALLAPWTAYVPVVSAGSGGFGTPAPTSTGAYLTIGKTVFFRQTITIPSIGTAGTDIEGTLPSTVKGSMACDGKYVNIGKSLQVEATGAGTGRTYAKLYDGSFPFVDGAILQISGFYEKA
jgi:hypothetical protein